MGIFDKIKDAIFGHHAGGAAHEAGMAPKPGAQAGAPAPVDPMKTGSTASTAPAANPAPSATPVPSQTSTPTSTSAPASPAPTSSAGAGAPSGGAATHGPVDVSAILDKAVKDKGQKLDWRHSIVDLMKALGMEASLSERKELAHELHYDGDMNDSGKMNMFLHKALLKRLSENGGTVPADLLD